jgi:serine/threonine-protein kinase
MRTEAPELAQALLDLADSTENLYGLKASPKKEVKKSEKAPRKEIDRWKILKAIPGGAFSDVYIATQKTKGPIKEDILVALKVIKPKNVTGITRSRFLQEMAIIAKFDHASVIRLVDYPKRKDSKEMWMATNYVSDWNFERLIRERGKINARQLNNFVRQLFNGLEHAARRNIVHGDIKPANLLLSRDGETLVIADFGLAFNWKMQVADIHTDISYRAPELFFPGGELTHASDVYSAAISIFEMASGRKVWSATRDPERIKTLAVKYGPSWEGVPASIREFIKPMLSANPKDRPKLEEITSHLRDNNISPWKKGTKYFDVAAKYTQRQTATFKK